MSEILPQIREVETPNYYYNTGERRLGLNWFNTKLKLYPETDCDCVEYVEEDLHTTFLVPERFWNQLLSDKYPISFYPSAVIERFWKNPEVFSSLPNFDMYYDQLNYLDEHTGNDIHFKWHNTRLRIYGEPEYNHIEVRFGNSGSYRTRGITDLTNREWRHLFENDFPIEYLPTVDMDPTTKQWMERRIDGARTEEG